MLGVYRVGMEERAQRPLAPARMLNEWTYCPRLAILEWVHGEFAHNAYTLDGARRHRRVDRAGPPLASNEVGSAGMDGWRTSALYLEAPAEGLVARLDVVESAGGELWPVDTKRGRVPDVPGGAYEPEQVQLCAQGLVLRAHGYRCERGYLYFVESRRRVEVRFDATLIARTRQLVVELRRTADGGELPQPLEDSPKCVGCSLAGICLPDETRFLRESGEPGPPIRRGSLRQLLAPVSEARPLYVTDSSARVGVRKGLFRVTLPGGEKVAEVRVRETSQIAIFGRAQVSTQALRRAMDADIPVCFFTFGGYFAGLALGHSHKNALLRCAQHEVARGHRALEVARELVRSKIRNQRTLLRRNSDSVPPAALKELRRLAAAARSAASSATLLGLEGAAAALYFRHFHRMFKGDAALAFEPTTRNRRPPRDPVNALLSFVYSLLTRDCAVAARATGLDPYVGLYHRPRYGKPALALDLMEEMRPLVGDSVVLTAVNNVEVRPSSFVMRATGCNLTSSGRRAVLRAYERRLAQEIRHPLFGYATTWRRMLTIQARVLGRFLLGEIPRYVPAETR